jgi:hypothetical protein
VPFSDLSHIVRHGESWVSLLISAAYEHPI